MGNKPSRSQVIEIKRVEIVKKPQPSSRKKPEDGSEKKEPGKPTEKKKVGGIQTEEGPSKKRERGSKTEEEESSKKREKGSKTDEEESSKKKEGSPKESPKKEPEKPKKEKKEKKDKSERDKKKSEKSESESEGKKRKRKKSDEAEPETSKEPGTKVERFESATDFKETKNTKDQDAKENIIKKIMRIIGVTQLTPKNFVILFVLWSIRFFVPWVNRWWNFNKHILSDPAHLAALESYLFTNEIIAFFSICLVTIGVSVFADVFNLKYYIYLILIAVFLLCPITGIVAINILWERGWNVPHYHKYAPAMYVWMFWMKSIPNIVYPLEFCCFFTQVDDMSREAHYNWSAIFVFLDSLNWLVCFYVIPGVCPTLQWTLASAWIAIGITIHTVFLLSCFFILWVKPANKVLNRTVITMKVVKFVNRMLTKIKMTACLIDETVRETKHDDFNEKATPFMKKMKLILFGLVLVPIIFSTFVLAIMHRLEVDEEWDEHEFFGATSMFMFGRVIGVVIIAVLLFFLRRNKKFKILDKYPITRADVLALGLPHCIIILALIIIAGRFGSLLRLEEGDVVIGPVPSQDRSVIEFYNSDFRNRTVCVFSEKFRPVKVGPRQRETRHPSDPGVTQYEVSVCIDPRTTPAVFTHEVLQFAKNSLISYAVVLNSSLATANDLEALYAKFQLVRFTGSESVKPQQVPQLIIMNTFMLNTSSYFVTVTQFQANFSEKVAVPEKGAAKVLEIKSGRVDLRYWNEGTNNTQDPTKPILDYMEVENFTVWTIVLGLATAHNDSNETEPYNVIMNKYLIMQVAGPNGNHLPDKRQLQQDFMVMLGTCLGGIAEAGIKVGFIYLFWLDTPIGELRVTTLAFFVIACNVPTEFPRLKLVDITTGVAVFLLCIQIMFTVAHFIGATFLYDQAFNFRKRDD